MHAFNKRLLSPVYAADILLAIKLIRLDRGHVALTDEQGVEVRAGLWEV